MNPYSKVLMINGTFAGISFMKKNTTLFDVLGVIYDIEIQS